MNLIDKQLEKIKKEKRLGLMTHVVVGYPSLVDTIRLVKTMEKAGVDIVELQIPFSDPLALINFDTILEGEIGELYKTFLAEDGITQEDFIFKQFPRLISETVYRDCFVPVKDFNYEFKDGTAVLKFSLPKGSYGSLVVKKLFC